MYLVTPILTFPHKGGRDLSSPPRRGRVRVVAFIAGLVLLTAVACSPQIKFADDEGRFAVSLDGRWEDTTDLAIDDWLANGDIRFELAFAASRFQVRENDPNLSPNVLARLNVLRGNPRQPGQSDNDQQWLTS